MKDSKLPVTRSDVHSFHIRSLDHFIGRLRAPAITERCREWWAGRTHTPFGRGERNHFRPTTNCATTASAPLINSAWFTPNRLTEIPVNKLPIERPPRMASMYRLTV